jgi:hypothetical protein
LADGAVNLQNRLSAEEAVRRPSRDLSFRWRERSVIFVPVLQTRFTEHRDALLSFGKEKPGRNAGFL